MGKSKSEDIKAPQKKMDIYFGDEAPSQHGYIKTLSLNGLEISSSKIFKPETILKLKIPTGKEPIRGEGKVRWADSEKQVSGDAFLAMGIKFEKRPENYAEFLEDLPGKADNRRLEPRFEKVFKVEFSRPEELVEEYSHNISKGGMFVVTKVPLELNSIVNIHIHIEDILKIIHAEGQVVHVISESTAKSADEKQGVGIKFKNFFDNDQEIFLQYIHKLKNLIEEK